MEFIDTLPFERTARIVIFYADLGCAVPLGHPLRAVPRPSGGWGGPRDQTG